MDYFLKNILNGENEFMRRLMTVIVDECHYFSDWEEICPDYKALGLLREALCDIPFMILSTTLSPAVHAHVINDIRFKESCSIKASIQRFNIRSFVVPIKQCQILDLNILIPDNPLESILVMLLYVDNINMGIDIAEQLRNRFPEGLRKHRSEVIHVFTGDLDAEAREVFIEDLRSGKIRIMVCTKTYGLNMDLHNIVRIMQWQISDLLTSSRLIQ